MIQFFQLYYAWKNEIIFLHMAKKYYLVIISKKTSAAILCIPNILFHTSEYIGRYLFISMPAYSNHKLKKIIYILY